MSTTSTATVLGRVEYLRQIDSESLLKSIELCVWIDLYYSYGPYTRRQDYSQGAIEICAKGH
eukprot:COSAG01_NODE_33456_length_563_cov_6.271552_1_plen_61_part_01